MITYINHVHTMVSYEYLILSHLTCIPKFYALIMSMILINVHEYQ